VGDHGATGAPSQNAAVPLRSRFTPVISSARPKCPLWVNRFFTEATGLSALPQNSIQGVLRRRTGMPAVNVRFGVICAR
jgi:hypothetical protein